MATEYTNGDKFTDGTVTLKYSKVAEPVFINTFDELKKDFDGLKGGYDTHLTQYEYDKNRFSGMIDSIINTAHQTSEKLSKLEYNENLFEFKVNGNQRGNETRDNMILIYIYNLLQIWPLRFLNWIFHWWTYQIINEERTENGREYIFYVTIILRGDKSRRGMKDFTAVYKQRITDVKKCMGKEPENVKFVVKPLFPKETYLIR